MKLFVNIQQDSKINDKVVDKSKYAVDLNTEITAGKTVTNLLTELKARVGIDSSKYAISDEKLFSEGVEVKKSEKVESLNLKALVYGFTQTKN